MELDELYTEIITQYSRSQKHRKPVEDPDVTNRGVNPSCGDDITLELKVEGDLVKSVGIRGIGCAISMASATIMAELAEGRNIGEIRHLIKTFLGMIQKTITDEEALEILEDAMAFKNISNMPARVKCAVLPWHTLDEALNKFESK